ncbi:hypothetical protein BASA81_012813 [Batrachochytrium salamandrivorans]|nr:hypothetical protein BASA81_012813 [Batrachochytrium salamandrivorans]
MPHMLTCSRFDPNSVGSGDVSVILAALTHPNNKVDFLENKVGNEGAKALAQALMHPNSKLQRLEIGVEGIKALAEALQHDNCTLTSLVTEFPWSAIIAEAQKDATVFQSLLVLLSARQVRRVGTRAAVRRLPSEMIRLAAQMVRIEARDGEHDEEENSSGSDSVEGDSIEGDSDNQRIELPGNKTFDAVAVFSGHMTSSNDINGRQSAQRASTSLRMFKQFVFRQPDGTLNVSGTISRECYESWLRVRRSQDCEAEAGKFYRALTNHVAGTSHPHIGQQYRSRGHHEKLASIDTLAPDTFAENVRELFHKLKPEDASYLIQMASHVVTHFGAEFTEEDQHTVYDLLRFAVLGRTSRCAVIAATTRAQELCNKHPSELTLVFDVTAKTWTESLLAWDLSSRRWALGMDPRELMRIVVAVGGAFHQPGTAFIIHQQSVVCQDSSRRRLDLTYVVDVESYYLVVYASA